MGHEASFQAFSGSVALAELVASAPVALETASAPPIFGDQALARLEKSTLTSSRQQLIFNYKRAFEAIRGSVGFLDDG